MLTLLLIDQEVHVGVKGDNDHVREYVASPDEHERLRIFHWNTLGNLHPGVEVSDWRFGMGDVAHTSRG